MFCESIMDASLMISDTFIYFKYPSPYPRYKGHPWFDLRSHRRRHTSW